MDAPSSSEGSIDLDRLAWRRLRRMRRDAVSRFRRSSLDAPDLETVLAEALQVVTQVLDIELAKVLEYNGARDALAVRAAHGWPSEVAGHVIQHATVIVRGQQAPWGVLSVHSRQRRMLTPHDVDFLQAVADVISAAAYRFLLVRRRGGRSMVGGRRPLPTSGH